MSTLVFQSAFRRSFTCARSSPNFVLRTTFRTGTASSVSHLRPGCHPELNPSLLFFSKILQYTRISKTPASTRFNEATSRSSQTRTTSRRSSPPPPWRRWTRHIDRIPSGVIFWGILALNGTVFLMWQYAGDKYKSTRDASLWIWLSKNFQVNLQNITSGRIWTLLTACFSHESTGHIFMNAFSYYFMAPSVLAMLGNRSFLALYLGGGIVSSVISLLWHNGVKHKQISSHGASGAIYAVISFFACVSPRTTFLIFAVIPCPAWVFVTGVFVWDFLSAVTDKRAGTDTAGHVGGILAGIWYFLRLRARALPRF